MVCSINLCGDGGVSLYDIGGFFVKLVNRCGRRCERDYISLLANTVEMGTMLLAGSVVCVSLYRDWIEV